MLDTQQNFIITSTYGRERIREEKKIKAVIKKRYKKNKKKVYKSC